MILQVMKNCSLIRKLIRSSITSLIDKLQVIRKGVNSQCRSVAVVVGLKTIVNEFTAYDRLGEFAKAGILNKRKINARQL